jgi:hypothetical protein
MAFLSMISKGEKQGGLGPTAAERHFLPGSRMGINRRDRVTEIPAGKKYIIQQIIRYCPR